jgi:hypothetical protein
VSLGVLALVWLLLGGTETALKAKFANATDDLLWIAVITVVGLLLDFVQSITALIEIDFAIRASEKAKRIADVGYDYPVFRFLSTSAFVLKLVATCWGALWLLHLIMSALTSPPIAS